MTDSLWLSVEDLCGLLGCKRTTFFAYMKDGRVPPPTNRINQRVTRWRRDDPAVQELLQMGPGPRGWFGAAKVPEAPPPPQTEPAAGLDRYIIDGDGQVSELPADYLLDRIAREEEVAAQLAAEDEQLRAAVEKIHQVEPTANGHVVEPPPEKPKRPRKAKASLPDYLSLV